MPGNLCVALLNYLFSTNALKLVTFSFIIHNRTIHSTIYAISTIHNDILHSLVSFLQSREAILLVTKIFGFWGKFRCEAILGQNIWVLGGVSL